MGLIIKQPITTDTGETITTGVYGRIEPHLNAEGTIIFSRADWFRSKSDFEAGKKQIKNSLKTGFKTEYNRTTDGNDLLSLALTDIKVQILVNQSWVSADIEIETLP